MMRGTKRAIRHLSLAAASFGAWLASLAFSPPVGAADDDGDGKSDGRADGKKVCLAQHEQSQVLRRDNKLTEARASLLACAQDACPASVRADCVDWLGAVGDAIPSIVVTAKVRGKDESNVRVFVDGQLRAERLDGIALELNPGVHKFRLEFEGEPPFEQEVLLIEGQKNRVLVGQFGPEPERTEPGAPPVDLYRPVPTLDYVLGGVALVGVASFAGFGAWGLSQKSSLEKSCAPVCTSDELSPVRSKFLIADASLGVAVAAVAVGAYVFITRPGYERDPTSTEESPEARPHFLILPTHTGALVGMEGAL